MSEVVYKVGDVVRAKPSGCPWKIAVIRSIKRDINRRLFIAKVGIIGKDLSYLLPLSRLAPFNVKYEDYSWRYETRLKSTILAALRIKNKQSTYASKQSQYYKQIEERKLWQSNQDISMNKKRIKCEGGRQHAGKHQPSKKLKKTEEAKEPEKPQSPVQSLAVSEKKIPSREVIPTLRARLSRILEHRDARRISEEEMGEIAECLEEIVLREVSMQVLVESKLGVLLKQFYDFVHSQPLLKELRIISHCAFRKLKKRACEVLFGITKSLDYLPESRDRPKSTEPPNPLLKEAEPSKEHKEEPSERKNLNEKTELPVRHMELRKPKQEKEGPKRAKSQTEKGKPVEGTKVTRWYSLRTRDIGPLLNKGKNAIRKPPVPRSLSNSQPGAPNLRRTRASNYAGRLAEFIETQRKLFDSRNARDVSIEVEWYVTILDGRTGEKCRT